MNRWACIARLGSIGDNLVAGSPLRALKRLGYMTEVIAAEPMHVVYHHNPYIDKLSVKRPERDLPKDDVMGWQKWMESRANEYDVFVHASHSLEGRHTFFRHMTQFWWPVEMRRKLGAGSFLETVHDIAKVPYDFGPLYFSSPEEHENALLIKRKLGKFILWVLCGTRVDKVYPYATHAIPRLIKELGAQVVVMGGPSDKEHEMSKIIIAEVTRSLGSRDGIHTAIPESSGERCFPLRTSLSFAQVADLVITPDTGPAWAVALEPMPKIFLASHSGLGVSKHWVNTTTLHADQDRVPCWPCHRLHDDASTCVLNKEENGAACISDISVERIVQAVAEKWRSNNVIHAEKVFPVARPA